MRDNGVVVACIQETKLRSSSASPRFSDYAFVRRDRPANDGGGGLAFIIRHDVEYSPVDVSTLLANDPTLEIQAIKIHLRETPLLVYNIYIRGGE